MTNFFRVNMKKLVSLSNCYECHMYCIKNFAQSFATDVY
uniref:Uncharacterized protein n=1 Tax=Anguilla anguilla TaxID=7936 RepID=A0A0E9XH30_ANGAN